MSGKDEMKYALDPIEAIPMTTDPALRAQLDQAYTNGFIDGQRGAALAAAEAAPLDVERLARAMANAGAYYRVDRPDGDHTMFPKTTGAFARDIAREYAALRSPDTEMRLHECPACGATHPRRPAVSLRSPDTETAGEAG